jgi:UDP-N-acetylglucosamine--N-acetylmuramyl-(pentapeptide) pyrophosphoryl-undecaprenol N-acetylglucosamine transferase
MNASGEFRIMVSGAGTGGHLFPGIAIVEAISALVDPVRTCFCVTGRPIEKAVLAGKKFETVTISASGFKGLSVSDKIRSVGLVVKGVVAARRLLRTFNPHLVLGMGGYSSAPVIVAAWISGIPRVIHEQNRIPGMTNRFLSRLSDRIYVSFPDTEIPGAGAKLRRLGYPVRRDIVKAGEGPITGDVSGGGKEKLTILILGGSQGQKRSIRP